MTDKSSLGIKYETRYIGGGSAPSAVVGQVELLGNPNTAYIWLNSLCFIIRDKLSELASHIPGMTSHNPHILHHTLRVSHHNPRKTYHTSRNCYHNPRNLLHKSLNSHRK